MNFAPIGIRSLLPLLVLTFSTAAHADVYKCRTASGKTVISDTGCFGDSGVESVRSSEFISPERQRQAAAVQAQRQRELNSIEAANTAWRNTPSPAAPVSAPIPAQSPVASDEEAVRQCIRDVERQGMSEKKKAELITACRTAGVSQRSTGIAGDAVSNCVRNVERAGASGAVKARQIALCHGGEVQPEPVPTINVPPPPQLSIVKSCNGPTCTDQLGNRYTTTYGKTVRNDGKRCYQQGSAMYCD